MSGVHLKFGRTKINEWKDIHDLLISEHSRLKHSMFITILFVK